MADTRIGGVYATFRADNNPWLRASRQNIAAIQRQNRALNDLRRSSNQLRNSTRQLSATFGALVGSAGGLGLASLSTRASGTAKAMSELGATLVENSQRLGLTARQIQLLGRVFEGGGASQQDFIRGFRTFNRNLVEARQGLEEYRRAFRLVGIDVDDLNDRNVSVYDTFLLVADGLEQFEDQANRVNAAQTLLGRSGTQLLNELQKGSDVLEESAENFASLGVVTDSQAARLKALAQSYTDATNAIRTSQQQVIADNAELFFELNRLKVEFAPAAFRGIVNGIEFVRRNFQLLSQAALILVGNLIITGPIGRFVAALAAGATSMAGFQRATAAASAALRTLRRLLLIGLAVEGIFLVVDAFRALEDQARETSRNIGDVFIDLGKTLALNFIASFVQGLADLFYAIPEFLSRDLARAFGFAGVESAASFFRQFASDMEAIPVQIGNMIRRSGGEAYQESVRQGQAVIDRFIQNLRERYRSLSGEVVALDPIQVTDTPFVPDPGEGASQERANLIRERANALLNDRVDINRTILTQARDRVEAAQFELSLLQQGIRADDSRRIVEEGLRDAAQQRGAILDQRIANQQRLTSLVELYHEADRAGLTTVASELRKQIRVLEMKIAAQLVSLNVSKNGTEELRRQLEEYRKLQDVVNTQTQEIQTQERVWMDLSQAASDFAGRLITDFKNIGEAAKDLGRTILQSLTQAFVVKPITAAITSFFGLPGFQSGGVGSGLAIVGEGGPELVDFRSPGRVYTNEELSAAVGGTGGAPVFHFSPVIQSADSDAVRRAVADAFPPFRAAIVGELRRESTRPSAIRSAMRR